MERFWKLLEHSWIPLKHPWEPLNPLEYPRNASEAPWKIPHMICPTMPLGRFTEIRPKITYQRFFQISFQKKNLSIFLENVFKHWLLNPYRLSELKMKCPTVIVVREILSLKPLGDGVLVAVKKKLKASVINSNLFGVTLNNYGCVSSFLDVPCFCAASTFLLIELAMKILSKPTWNLSIPWSNSQRRWTRSSFEGILLCPE